MVASLEALPFGAIPLLLEHCTRHPKAGIALELGQNELEIVRIKRQISVKIAHDLITKAIDTLVSGVEGLHLGCEAAVTPWRDTDQFNPRVAVKITAHNV